MPFAFGRGLCLFNQVCQVCLANQDLGNKHLIEPIRLQVEQEETLMRNITDKEEEEEPVRAASCSASCSHAAFDVNSELRVPAGKSQRNLTHSVSQKSFFNPEVSMHVFSIWLPSS